jgi:hypothetical protein
MILGLAGAAYATDASADNIMITKAAPAVTTKAPPQPATCGSLEHFVVTSCPLTWYVTWQSHGAPFNGTAAVGDAKRLERSRFVWPKARTRKRSN